MRKQNNSSTIVSLLTSLLTVPLGAILGILGWREYERYQEERLFMESASQHADIMTPIMYEEDMGPRDATCEVCASEFKTISPPGATVTCPHCDQQTEV